METQTQGKVFIVVGSIGLLISAYFLVTAFFGWSNNTRESTQEQHTTNNEAITTDTGIQIQDDGEIDFTQLLLDGQEEKNLHVLIPEFLFTSWFETIAQDIEQEIWFSVIFHTPQTLSDLHKREEERIYNNQQIDIALIPTELLNSLTTNSKSVSIAESLTPYYHDVFASILDQEEYTFIPHSIDPLVIFAQENSENINNAEKWLNTITWRDNTQRWYFPILFWRTNQDRQFIKQNRQLFENHFLITYHIINQAIHSTDPLQTIQTILDIQELTQTTSRSVADFISNTKKLVEQNIGCERYPNICLFTYQPGNIRFGILSDIHKFEKYFTDARYQIYPFWFNDSYPARWWGFVINNNSPSETRVLYFLENYIQASLVEINPDLRDRTIAASLSANSSINDTQTQWDLYSNENSRDMLISNNKYITENSMIQEFIQVREWLLTPEQFITNNDI